MMSSADWAPIPFAATFSVVVQGSEIEKVSASLRVLITPPTL